MPVVAVTESQVVDAASNLTDVYEFTYTIPDRPGSFTVAVPKAGNPVDAAIAAINNLTEVVTGIYNIP